MLWAIVNQGKDVVDQKYLELNINSISEIAGVSWNYTNKIVDEPYMLQGVNEKDDLPVIQKFKNS